MRISTSNIEMLFIIKALLLAASFATGLFHQYEPDNDPDLSLNMRFYPYERPVYSVRIYRPLILLSLGLLTIWCWIVVVTNRNVFTITKLLLAIAAWMSAITFDGILFGDRVRDKVRRGEEAKNARVAIFGEPDEAHVNACTILVIIASISMAFSVYNYIHLPSVTKTYVKEKELVQIADVDEKFTTYGRWPMIARPSALPDWQTKGKYLIFAENDNRYQYFLYGGETQPILGEAPKSNVSISHDLGGKAPYLEEIVTVTGKKHYRNNRPCTVSPLRRVRNRFHVPKKSVITIKK